jgi:hypothetical protein
MTPEAAGVVTAEAAIADAIKASGVLVHLAPAEFSKILSHATNPLVVIAEGGFFSATFQYLTSYKGLAFFTKSDVVLQLPPGTEVVTAERIHIPG